MVNTLLTHAPVTPVGKPATVAPVAPRVAYEMVAMAPFAHTVWAFVPVAEVKVMELIGFTVKVNVVAVPVQLTVPLV